MNKVSKASLLLITVLLVSCAQKVKILTYNVGVFSKYMEDSKEGVAKLIRELDVDIVSLNELDSCNTRHDSYQLEELADEAGDWNYRFAKALEIGGGAYGNGVITPEDIIDSKTVLLDSHGGAEKRSIQIVETKDYVFASTHLDYVKDRPNYLQARDLNDYFVRYYSGYPKPVILAGDFNFTTENPGFTEISRLWHRISPDNPTYPSPNPEKCIDFIFYLKTARPVKTIDSKVVKIAGSTDVKTLSDHLPVYAEVAIGKERPSFNFVHWTDTQIGFFDYDTRCMHSDTLMNLAVQELNRIKPELVVITGDLLDAPGWDVGPLQDSIYRANIAKIDPAIKVFELPGNHDMNPYNEKNHADYLALRGYERFSERIRNCAFIGINSNPIKDGYEAAEQEQFEWLEQQLADAFSCDHRFIFLHCPIIRERIDEPEDYFNFPIPKREKYISLFKKYGVEAVFAGHTHMDYYTVYDGIQFIAAGPVGNALSRGYPGFGIVNVSKDEVISEYVATPLPEGIGKWTYY